MLRQIILWILFTHLIWLTLFMTCSITYSCHRIPRFSHMKILSNWLFIWSHAKNQFLESESCEWKHLLSINQRIVPNTFYLAFLVERVNKVLCMFGPMSNSIVGNNPLLPLPIFTTHTHTLLFLFLSLSLSISITN